MSSGFATRELVMSKGSSGTDRVVLAVARLAAQAKSALETA